MNQFALFQSDFLKTTAQPSTACCEPLSSPSKFGRQNGKTKWYEDDCGSGQNQHYKSNDQNDATCEKHDDAAPNWRILFSAELPRY
jgi:hypothetical protein